MDAENVDRPLLSRREVARRFGVSPRTLEAWERNGLLDGATVKLGRLRRYKPDAVDHLCEAGTGAQRQT